MEYIAHLKCHYCHAFLQRLESSETDLTVQHMKKCLQRYSRWFLWKLVAKSCCTTECYLNVQLTLIIIVKSTCLFVVKERVKLGCWKKMCREHKVSSKPVTSLHAPSCEWKTGSACGGRHTRLLLNSVFCLWSQFHGRILPEQDLKYKLSIWTKCILPQRAWWVDRNVVMYSSLLCKIKNTL